jgi:hypothetical protein
LGKSVYTTYLFPFEATAALLVIAVVGAVVLARRPPAAVNPVDADPALDDTEPDPEPEPGTDPALPASGAEADATPHHDGQPEEPAVPPATPDAVSAPEEARS